MTYANDLLKVVQPIEPDAVKNADKILNALFENIDKVYSYYLSVEYTDNIVRAYYVHYNLSMEEELNTIPTEIAVNNILKSLHYSKKTRYGILASGQPPLDTMVKIYKPFIKKFANTLCTQWPLEYDDAIGIINLYLCKLYQAGYYIHKRLIKRSVYNYIYGLFKKDKDGPQIVSLYSLNEVDQELIDSITDESVEAEYEEILDTADKNFDMEIERSIIIDEIGKRQYDQLLRAYRMGITTSTDRMLLQRLIKKVKENNF